MDSEFDLEGAPDPPLDDLGFTIPDGRLSVAITLEEAQDVLHMTKPRCRAHKFWRKVIEERQVTQLTPEVCSDYHTCVAKWLAKNCPPDVHQPLVQYLKMALRVTEISKQHQYQKKIPQLNHDLSGYSALEPLFKLRLSVDKFKTWYRNNWKGQALTFKCDNEIIYDSTLCLFNCDSHGVSLSPTSLILSCLDSIQRRFSAFVYAIACEVYNVFPDQNFFPKVTKLDHLIVCARSDLGNHIYRVLGAWYSLFVSILIQQQGDLNCSRLYQEVVKSLEEHIPMFSVSELFAAMTTISPGIEGIRAAFEATGLAKAYGCPIADFLAGLETVREYACVDHGTDLTAANKLERAFKSRFCMAYYRKHGRWPLVKLSPSANPILRNCVDRNIWPRSNILRGLSDSIFDELTFEKTFDFDYHVEVFYILSDKACAPELAHWSTLYDPCAFELHYGVRPEYKPHVDRRVISRFLTSDEGHTINVISELDCGRPDPNDNIVVLVPKEGELKVEARPFAIVTCNKRLHVGLVGKNVARDISCLFTTQTMNDSEITLLKKVSRYATEGKTHPNRTLYIILDFKKFNLQWSLVLLVLILMCLDRLYGFKMSVECHSFYQRAYFVSNLRTRPPKPDPQGYPTPGAYCHINHDGGTEGMFQRIWSVAVSLMIEEAMRHFNMRGSIIGQGDNQVIVCRLTSEQAANAPQFAEDFLSHLDREQQRYGVPLKKTECWYSNQVYEANKELYVCGRQLTNGMKYASKIASDSNDATNVFETKRASVATMAETISKRMMTADVAYFVATVELLIQTSNASLCGEDLNEYFVVPFWGTALGGLPIAFYNQLVIRGHPDRLTLNLSIAKYLSMYERDIFMLLCKYSPMEFSKNQNPELLLLDAHALDFPRHLSVASYLKAKVRGVIRARSTNPTITKYFSEETTALNDTVVQSILSMRPFAAHLAMELYRCSNAGIVLQFVALFENSRTLVRLTQQTLGASIVEDVKERERSYFGYLDQLRKSTAHSFRLRDLVESHACMTQLAENLRSECWGFDVVGATVAAPMDQTRLLAVDAASDSEINKSIIITCSDELTSPHNTSSLGVGPFRAYLGSKTVEKTTKSSHTEVPTTVPAQAALRLETLKTWIARVGGPNLKALVQILIEEKGLDLSQYAPRVERGDIYHRLKTPLDSSGAIINSVLQ